MSMNTSELKDKIITAFKNTPFPQGRLTDTFDDEGVSDYFLGKSWEGHDVSDLRYNSVALSFFEPEAFRYYLPAFMLAELENHVAADTIGESIVFHFSRPKKYWENIHEKRLSLFTSSEKEAILNFLDYMQAEYGLFEDAVIYASSRLCS